MTPGNRTQGRGGYGAYGKMPALGDFFRFGLPPGFVDPWDRWLQTGMAGLRESLGARWEACYMTAPIWRFTLAAGLAGPQAAQGVLMPSVDQVGRQFPLTLARILPGQPGAAAADAAAQDAFEALEEVALDALDDGMTRDRLADRLATVPVPPPAVPAGPSQHSIWSALIDGQVRRIVHAGLPGPVQMRAFLDPARSEPPPESPAGPQADPFDDLPAEEARP